MDAQTENTYKKYVEFRKRFRWMIRLLIVFFAIVLVWRSPTWYIAMLGMVAVFPVVPYLSYYAWRETVQRAFFYSGKPLPEAIPDPTDPKTEYTTTWPYGAKGKSISPTHALLIMIGAFSIPVLVGVYWGIKTKFPQYIGYVSQGVGFCIMGVCALCWCWIVQMEWKVWRWKKRQGLR